MAIFTEQDIVNNVLQGTDAADSIQFSSSSLDVTVNAGDGDDAIYIGTGANNINGGAGEDTAYLTYISTGWKDDYGLTAYSNNNGVITMTSEQGTNTFTGVELFNFSSTVSNISYGISPTTSTVSVAQLDSIYNQADQLISGTVADDELIGAYGNDTINGGAGNDRILGLPGNDILNGGVGNDTLIGGEGNNIIDGGDGDDTVMITATRLEDITAYSNNNGVVTITSAQSTDVISNVENVQLAFSYFGGRVYKVTTLDSIFQTQPQQILGTAESETLWGGLGNDTINAGDGDDTVNAQSGNDIVNGDAGSDEIYAGVGDDVINGGVGNDTILGEEGNDTAHGGDGDDGLVGGSGDDLLYGGLGNDRLYGDQGNDTLNGDDGDDELWGGSDTNQLNAGAGNDYIYGGTGDDKVDGGTGLDVFLIRYSIHDAEPTTLQNISKLKNGGYSVVTNQGFDEIRNVEYVTFQDGITQTSSTPEELLAAKAVPTFKSNGVDVMLDVYQGPVEYLEYTYLGQASNDVMIGSLSNDFLNLQDGDDAADGGAGDDVLDGGAGSNFLTGGQGNDTFFLDGREGGTTWSTVTDFSGDSVNLWGWVNGVSKRLLVEENAGADAFKGVTFHYDLNNDGDIDTSVTFSGLTAGDVPEETYETVEDNGYLLFA